ncbi:MAG: serine/threonine protein kinase [Oscillospiraceae bacterium]
MDFCPHCMYPASGPVCKRCGKSTSWTPGEQQLPAGTMLDGSGLHRYLTGAAIGQGGFGITYIAVEPDSGKRVAVKECFPVQCAVRAADGKRVEPKPGMSSQLQGALNSFLDEARLLAKQTELKSVVQVEDFFSTNGTAYLVMEYLDGVTLSDKMKAEGRLPAQQLLSMLRPLMEDIGKLHASGIIHRDISPDNIMWMPDNTLKLLDFGCARSMEDGKSMSVLLKHGFAPVEQYQTRGQGPWTDIYSLCATVYYCITGTLPTSAVERLEGDALVPPTALGAELTPREETALLWGLAVQPTRRPQNIELLIGQLCPTPKKPSSAKSPKSQAAPVGEGREGLRQASSACRGGDSADCRAGAHLRRGGGATQLAAYGRRQHPAASASPRPSRRRPSPVDGVSDGVEYTSYGDRGRNGLRARRRTCWPFRGNRRPAGHRHRRRGLPRAERPGLGHHPGSVEEVGEPGLCRLHLAAHGVCAPGHGDSDGGSLRLRRAARSSRPATLTPTSPTGAFPPTSYPLPSVRTRARARWS